MARLTMIEASKKLGEAMLSIRVSSSDDFNIPVTVIDYVPSFGIDRWRVKPVNRERFTNVDESRLTWPDDE